VVIRDQVDAVAQGLRALGDHPDWHVATDVVAQAALKALEDAGWRLVWGGAVWRKYPNHDERGMVAKGSKVLAAQLTWEEARERFPGIQKDSGSPWPERVRYP
jgi:hypothetical protein